MKINYLGTGAAERIPGIFCNCKLCKYAREKKGREIRTQTQLIIDDVLLIDFPGDSYLHLLQYDLCFADFDSLLISHWHSDHFYGEDLAYRMSGYALDIPNRLTVYGNEAVKTFYQRAFDLEGRQDDTRLQYQVIQPYKCFTIANYTIYPLPAQHGNFSEDCFIFVIDDGKDAFLSTHDTGYFTSEMFEYLEKSHLLLSIVSLDCTSQTNETGNSHMNWEENLKLIAELKERKLVTDKTIYVANHFSNNGGLSYAEMAALSQKHEIITSYDGLEILT
ncbi:MBL fold metallo-hydrolase [Enterococcus faecalis]|uniref:MBL fold metallo-hydrolase n=1 Tax=Enterococcus faecalis TaxID=1351 RepID=UPI0029354C37|nr:MBL fold metallo-hydrolase [Enterococcus faecalis]MDV2539618.1 MBL fold metallo-hydrolase [Enterococcus faecalis]